MKTEFVGRLAVMKGEEDRVDESAVVEVCDVKDGNDTVEIAFNDRGERVWLTFSLADLRTAIAAKLVADL